MPPASPAASFAKRAAVAVGYFVAVIVGATLALTPSILLFPQRESDDLRIALVALIVIGLLLGAWARPAARRAILIWTSVGGFITVATVFAMKWLPVEAQLMIPTPNFLPRLLGADGELADDTLLYEVVNEIWLLLAAIAVAGGLLLRKNGGASRAA